MGAAEKGRTDIARVLLDSGARASAVNHEKRTAMTYAAKSQHDDIVALLKNAGAK
jgi:ankyrin repeat protein